MSGVLTLQAALSGGIFNVLVAPEFPTGTGAGSALTQTAVATPQGGTPPYAYSWVISDGDWTILNPTNQSTAFSYSSAFPGTYTASATVSVVDANGAISTGVCTPTAIIT